MINRYKELDALRGIAALMIVLFHLTLGVVQADQAFKYGTTGIDLFFIISGFVIFMSLQKITKSTDFLLNRIIRLYPTYWTSVTFTFILYCIYNETINEINIVRYIANMSMFQYYMKIRDLDGPYWTLIIEMNFYLGIWCLFHFKLINYLNYIGLCLSVFTVVISQFLYEEIGKVLIYLPLLQFIPLFFAGTIFYNLYVKEEKKVQNYSLLFVCLICQLLLFNHAGRSRNFISLFEYTIMLSLFFAIFVLFVNNKLKFIINKSTLFLGKISFALYLTHQYVSLKFLLPAFQSKVNFALWPAILSTLIITIIIAALITYYIEVPVTKKIKRKMVSEIRG